MKKKLIAFVLVAAFAVTAFVVYRNNAHPVGVSTGQACQVQQTCDLRKPIFYGDFYK